jgi:hypothetical protein
MKIVNVPVGAIGIDTVTAITETSVQIIKEKVDFVVRYLGGVSTTEIALITEAGLGVQLVTYSRAPGWMPSATMGAEDGDTDVVRLKALGIPEGMVVFIDLEGSGGDAADTASWVNARAKTITQAGYIAGLYIGDSCVLDAEQLYSLPDIKRYWVAFNRGTPVPSCGVCMRQLFPPNQTLGGIYIDWDSVQADYSNRVPTMLVE